MVTTSEMLGAYGLGVLHSEHGKPFRFGGVWFSGVSRIPEPSDRGVPGGTAQGLEYSLEIEVQVSAFKSGFPRSGSTIWDACDKSYVIVGFRQSPGSNKISLLVRQP